MKMQADRIGVAVDERAIIMILTNVEGIEMDKVDISSKAVTRLVGIANNDDDDNDGNDNDDVAPEVLRNAACFAAPLEQP